MTAARIEQTTIQALPVASAAIRSSKAAVLLECPAVAAPICLSPAHYLTSAQTAAAVTASLTSYLLAATVASTACIEALLVYSMPELRSTGFAHTARTAAAGSPSLDAARLGSPLSPQVLL